MRHAERERRTGDEDVCSSGRARGVVGRVRGRGLQPEPALDLAPRVDPHALDGWDEARAAFDVLFEWV